MVLLTILSCSSRSVKETEKWGVTRPVVWMIGLQSPMEPGTEAEGNPYRTEFDVKELVSWPVYLLQQ